MCSPCAVRVRRELDLGVLPTLTERALSIGPPLMPGSQCVQGRGREGPHLLVETCASGAEERDSTKEVVAPWGRLLHILSERSERWASASGCRGLQPAFPFCSLFKVGMGRLAEGLSGRICATMMCELPRWACKDLKAPVSRVVSSAWLSFLIWLSGFYSLPFSSHGDIGECCSPRGSDHCSLAGRGRSFFTR